MNILIYNNDEFYYSIGQTAKYCGYNTVIYNGKKPFHEVAFKFKPNIVLFDGVDKQVIEFLKRHPFIYSFYRGNTKTDKEVFNCYNISHLEYAANILNGNYQPNSKWFFMTVLADKTKENEEILSGFLDYRNNHKIKLFSKDNWPSEYYCGDINEINFSIVANISKYTLVLKNSNMLYNSVLCNTFVMSNIKLDNILTIQKATDIVNNVMLSNDNEHFYNEYINTSRRYVITNHTYFHRLQSIFDMISMPCNAMQKLEELI